MTLDLQLLKLLVCPKCRTAVEYRRSVAGARPEPSDTVPLQAEDTENSEWLVCTSAECGLAYRVSDGIPIMLIDQAVPPHEIGDTEPVV